MERFLTNFKQKCPVEPSNEGRMLKRQRYVTEKRKRDFIPSICTKYKKTGTFITGCKNY
jgi:hypothetical protein